MTITNSIASTESSMAQPSRRWPRDSCSAGWRISQRALYQKGYASRNPICDHASGLWKSPPVARKATYGTKPSVQLARPRENSRQTWASTPLVRAAASRVASSPSAASALTRTTPIAAATFELTCPALVSAANVTRAVAAAPRVVTTVRSSSLSRESRETGIVVTGGLSALGRKALS